MPRPKAGRSTPPGRRHRAMIQRDKKKAKQMSQLLVRPKPLPQCCAWRNPPKQRQNPEASLPADQTPRFAHEAPPKDPGCEKSPRAPNATKTSPTSLYMLVVFSPMKLVNRDRYDFLSCTSKSPLRSVTRKDEHQTPNVWYRKANPGKTRQTPAVRHRCK